MASQSVILPITPSFSSHSHNSSPNFITVFTSSFTGLKVKIELFDFWKVKLSEFVFCRLPEKEATEKKSAKWSFRFIKSFAMGELEARKLKFNSTGTEALLMGILVEGTSIAAKLLRESGVTLFKVREETVKLLGKSDMYIFSPEHPPLTEPAQRAIDWAINEKLKSGETGEVTTSHLLLGIWAQKESAGHKIMATLGFDDDKAQELAKSMDKEIILSYKRGL